MVENWFTNLKKNMIVGHLKMPVGTNPMFYIFYNSSCFFVKISLMNLWLMIELIVPLFQFKI